MLQHAEEASVRLHHHAKVYVEGGSVLCERLLPVHLAEIILDGILYISAGESRIGSVHIGCTVAFVEIFQPHEAALLVHLGHGLAVFICRHDAGNTRSRGHALVIGTESRCDMYDSRTVGSGDVIAGDDPEGAVLQRLEPGNELPVADAAEIRTLEDAVQDAERHDLVSLGVFHGEFGTLGIEPGAHQVFRQYVNGLFSGVLVERKDADIFDAGPYAQRRIAGKGPGRGGPGEDVHREIGLRPGEQLLRCGVADDFELHRGGGIAHVPIASGLVQFVGAESGAVRGTVGLDGVALVQQSFVIYLLEQPPERLYIAVVIGDIGVLHVHPVTYAVGHGFPLGGVFHHFFAAGAVVFFHTDAAADVGLGDAEFLLHAEFDGESVGVPARPAADFESRLRFVTADGILNAAGHHMVDARFAVGRGRSFEEYEFGSAFTYREAALERRHLFPSFQHPVAGGYQIKSFILFECHLFSLNL